MVGHEEFQGVAVFGADTIQTRVDGLLKGVECFVVTPVQGFVLGELPESFDQINPDYSYLGALLELKSC
ncbi:MAG: hypothetical protein V1790_10655, partial [Planctomycetota bacterium]